jgi:hypothetical protein
MNRLPIHKSSIRAFTQLDAMVITGVVAAVLLFLLGILLPALGKPRINSNPLKNASQLRGIHQSLVIFAQNNNTHLPGLDSSGNILPASAPLFSSAPGNASGGFSGASISARYYILLNGSFVAGDLLINPQDVLTKWASSTLLPTTDQFSYTALRIGIGPQSTDIGHHKTRAGEWRDNANSQAILLSDRNTASTPVPNAVRSVWSTAPTGPDWKGTVLWGDNHAEFLNAPNARLGTLSLNTKYGSAINTDDFLFGEFAMPGKSPADSAMFGYTFENF